MIEILFELAAWVLEIGVEVLAAAATDRALTKVERKRLLKRAGLIDKNVDPARVSDRPLHDLLTGAVARKEPTRGNRPPFHALDKLDGGPIVRDRPIPFRAQAQANSAARMATPRTPTPQARNTTPTMSVAPAPISILVGIGMLLGALSVLVVPHRVMPVLPLPGLSLFLTPLGTGLVMRFYGRWCDKRGRARSRLASFADGALFAFALAFTRFLLMQLS